MSQKELWYETLHTNFGQYFSVENVLYREKTEHQDLVIFDNPVLGRVMALDGVESAKADHVTGTVEVEMTSEVSFDKMKEAVESQDYKVIS